VHGLAGRGVAEVELAQLHAHVGIPRRERPQDQRRQLVGRRTDEPHHDVAEFPTSCPFRHLRGPLHLGEGLAHLVEEEATGAGQPHVVRGAVEQPSPQLAFEPADLLAERRLCDVLALGRPPKVQLLGERDEIPQLTEFHPTASRPLPPGAACPRDCNHVPGLNQSSPDCLV
jgi:hypothetical protein